MSRDVAARGAPWLGLLGSVILVSGLFLFTRTEVPPEKEGPEVVEVLMDQVRESVEAACTENPSLAGDRSALVEEMKTSAESQALLVAEGFSQGIVADDYIVRNRLVEIQVMSLYQRADAGVTDEAVRQYFSTHADLYRKPAVRRIIHLFAPVTNRVGPEVARSALDALRGNSDAWTDPAWTTEDGLARTHGSGLARFAFQCPLGAWSDAVETPLGWHALLALEEEPEAPCTLDEVRTRVSEDLRRTLRREAYQEEIKRLQDKYRVEWID